MTGLVAFLVVLVVAAMVTVMVSNVARSRRWSNQQNAGQYFIDPLTGQPIQPNDQGNLHHGGHPSGAGGHGGSHHGGGFSDGGHHGGGFSGGGGGGDSGGGGHHH